MNENYTRWKNTGLLNGLNENEGNWIADCLEVQRKLNETADGSPMFKRVSIPVVRRVFGSLKHLNNITSESTGLQHKYTFRNYVPFSEYYREKFGTFKSENNLDMEAEWTADLSEQIGNEISSELLSDHQFVFGGFVLENDSLSVIYSKNSV